MKSETEKARPRAWRSRWAAIGAAVAVSLGAGGLMVADAVAKVAKVDKVDNVENVDGATTDEFFSAASVTVVTESVGIIHPTDPHPEARGLRHLHRVLQTVIRVFSRTL